MTSQPRPSAQELYLEAISKLAREDAACLPVESFPDELRESMLRMAEYASFNRKSALAEVVDNLKKHNKSKRKEGELYSTINSVWKPVRKEFADAFAKMCRLGTSDSAKIYAQIRTEAQNVGNGATDAVPRIQIDGTSSKCSSTPSALNGPMSIDIFGVESASRAHCVPDDKVCCSAYGLIAQAVVGAPDLEHSDHAIKALRTLVYGARSNGANGKRIGIRGLKNLAENRVALPTSHEQHFDTNGNWLITPIMTLQETKEWTAETEYFALAICHGTRSYQALFRGADYEDEHRKDYLQKCTPAEITTATHLLREIVKGVAELSSRDDESNPLTPIELIPSGSDFHPANAEEQQKRENAIESKKESMRRTKNHLSDGQVDVPDIKGQYHLLMKVKIRKVEGMSVVTDPMLLAIKAAVMWSQRQGHKLLPACSIPVTVERDSESEVDDCATECDQSLCDSEFPALQQTGNDPPLMLLRFLETQREDAMDPPRRVTPEKGG